MSDKKQIAQITRASIGRTVVVGRDEMGYPIHDKLPSKAGEKFLDKAGNESHVDLACHRVNTAETKEKYGRRIYREKIAEGWLPKNLCPLTEQFEDLVGGPLITPLKGEKKCKLDRAEVAHLESIRQWHGCEHYRRVKAQREEVARQKGEAMKSFNPTEAMIELAKGLQARVLDKGSPLEAVRETRKAQTGVFDDADEK